MKLRVSEMFYSLQGEGARSGEPSLFVRLQGCSAKHACYESGVRCDTEFESGSEVSLEELGASLVGLQPQPERCRWIVWTGGEPLDQLTSEALSFFSDLGYFQALETSGVVPLRQELLDLLDWVVLSPKVAEHVLEKTWTAERDNGNHVDELRYVRHTGQSFPAPKLKAERYFVSPHSDGQDLNHENVRHCVRLCLRNPTWRLSLQLHKVMGLL